SAAPRDRGTSHDSSLNTQPTEACVPGSTGGADGEDDAQSLGGGKRTRGLRARGQSGGTTMSLALACAATRRGTPRGRRGYEGAWCAGGRPRGPRVPPPPQAKASPEARQLFASPDWLVGRLSQAHQACCTEGAGARFPSKNNKQLK
ncbi:unnamed protein product, partial [Prorocentrum cordatum]